MCTANLNACAVHLPRQEEQHGAVALLTEWWVERGLQEPKAVCKYRLSQNPEVLMVNELLTRHALSKLAASGVAATFDDIVPEYRSKPLNGPAFDSGDRDTNILLLHAGTLLTGYSPNDRLRQERMAELCVARDATAGFVHIYRPGGCARRQRRRSGTHLHTQPGQPWRPRDLLQPGAQPCPRSGGYWVLVTFRGQQYLGEIIRYLRVMVPPQLDLAAAGEVQPLRLAICRFFNPLRQQGQVFRVSTSSPADGRRLRAVDIAQIDTALISTVDPAAAAGGGGRQLRLVRFNNCSRQ
jgi:hypothetical protein